MALKIEAAGAVGNALIILQAVILEKCAFG